MVSLDAVSVVYAIVAGVTGGITILAWRKRPSPGATTLAVLMAAVAGWNLSLLAFDFVTTHTGARVVLNFAFIWPAITTAAFFAFALEYTGYEGYLRTPYVYLLGIEPIAVAVLAATNPWHFLFWARPGVYKADGVWTFASGLGSSLHLVYAYVLVAVGTLLVFRRLYTAKAVHKRQTYAILIGVIAPAVGNVLFVAGVTEVGQVAGFVVTGVVVYWAITEYRLADLTPVARATVLDELEVGVLVVDREHRITDINTYCRRLFGIESKSSVMGDSIQTVVTEPPELVRHLASGTAFETTFKTDIEDSPHTLIARASVLHDDLDRRVGRLVLFEDITDERARQQELQDRNEQLQEFASLVSHDLRNPLDVASGYVELMRESRDRSGSTTTMEEDYLDETADALERIESIVDDVLTLAREGEGATDPETVSLRSTSRTAWDHVDTAGANLVVGTDAMVLADRGQLTRIFENLFRNAIEHAGPEAAVSVGVITGEEGAEGFYIEDDGPGIDPERREDIFESGVTSETGGTGFGLAIVDKLSSAHDWTVDITESDEGGARFEFTAVEFTSEGIPDD